MSVIALAYIIFFTFLGGVGLVVVGLYYKRNFFRGKIKCIFYTRSDGVEEHLIRPNGDNQIVWNGGNYLFVRDAIKLGRTFLGEGISTLTFVEDNPYPLIFVEKYAADIGEVTSRQIAADFDDKMARELGAVTSVEGEFGEAAMKKLQNTVIIVGLIIIGVSAIGFWFVGSNNGA